MAETSIIPPLNVTDKLNGSPDMEKIKNKI